jgi:hypothetical protein
MSRGLRSFATALTVLTLVATSAPAMAEESVSETDRYDSRGNAPPMMDVLVLRPLGLFALGVGAGLFAVISPVMLVTRPQELGKPFEALVAGPARYVWSDPIGSH